MSALIWFGILAVYVAGLFPAAVQAVRLHASTFGSCHDEDKRGETGGPKWRSWCESFHKRGCWRTGEPSLRDLRAMPAALIWPLALIGLVVLSQAKKRPPVVRDLQGHIDDLERELGIGA